MIMLRHLMKPSPGALDDKRQIRKIPRPVYICYNGGRHHQLCCCVLSSHSLSLVEFETSARRHWRIDCCWRERESRRGAAVVDWRPILPLNLFPSSTLTTSDNRRPTDFRLCHSIFGRYYSISATGFWYGSFHRVSLNSLSLPSLSLLLHLFSDAPLNRRRPVSNRSHTHWTGRST